MNQPEPRWDIDYEDGRQAELWVESIQKALKDGGIEVKLDRRAPETGNIYIEYQCLRRGRWEDSGIRTTAAPLYVICIPGEEMGLVIETQALREMCQQFLALNPWAAKEERDGSHPTKGIVIELCWLMKQIRTRARSRFRHGQRPLL